MRAVALHADVGVAHVIGHDAVEVLEAPELVERRPDATLVAYAPDWQDEARWSATHSASCAGLQVTFGPRWR